MKTSNSKTKAKAFLGAAFVLLITLIFTACPNPAKPEPQKSKHTITFSVDGTGGTLKAKADGVAETDKSPITVEEGKTVTFTAEPSTNYKVKEWKVDGAVVANNKTNTYTHTVTKAVTIKVSFESNGTTPTPKPKHTITFSVDGANGTLKAKAEGVAETEKSPISVEEGKTVTFTAKANSGYRVKAWTLDGKPITEAGTKAEYKLTVTKPATVKVFFEAIPPAKYTVTLTQTANGTVTALPAIPADGKVDKDTEITFTAKAEAGYRVNTWVISPSEAIQSGGKKGNETATVKITADTTVSVSFELIPDTVILTLSPDKLNISVSAKTADGSAIEVEGCNEKTLASEEETELHATGTVVLLKGKITELNCSNNQLTALNVKGLTALEELLCRKNQLTDLDVSGLTTLKTLGCNSNQLASLNVSGCIALETLGCFRNRLTALNVQGLTSLKKLGCQGNQLTTLDISGLTALKRLGCYNNKLNTQAMTELLNALPTRKASDDAKATLYTEKTEPVEENCKDYNTPAELKTALEGARGKNWKLLKEKTNGTEVDI